MEEDLTLGGEHKMQNTDDVLQNYTFETYMIFKQCHPKKFNLKKNKKELEKKCMEVESGWMWDK